MGTFKVEINVPDIFVLLDEMAKYDAVMAPLFEQLINNALHARNLATLRDMLLPRLISGRLRLVA